MPLLGTGWYDGCDAAFESLRKTDIENGILAAPTIIKHVSLGVMFLMKVRGSPAVLVYKDPPLPDTADNRDTIACYSTGKYCCSDNNNYNSSS